MQETCRSFARLNTKRPQHGGTLSNVRTATGDIKLGNPKSRLTVLRKRGSTGLTVRQVDALGRMYGLREKKASSC